jgi:hypothetical protein
MWEAYEQALLKQTEYAEVCVCDVNLCLRVSSVIVIHLGVYEQALLKQTTE